MTSAGTPGRLEGKVAFVTGAARGQGRSHALRLAAEGADVIAVDLGAKIDTAPHTMPGPEELAETAEAVRALGRRCVSAIVDVRDREALGQAVGDGVAKLGRLDAVVANAGIAGFLPMTEIGPAEWKNMIDVNLTGVFFTCQAALPHLLATGDGGSIVLTSSTAGARGHANLAHYVAAKHGVLGIMKTLAKELAPHFVRVNAVLPTAVDTPMFQHDQLYRLYRPDLESPTVEDAIPSFKSVHLLDIPWVEVEDITNAVLFLLSDESRYVTGTALPIDAGKSQA